MAARFTLSEVEDLLDEQSLDSESGVESGEEIYSFHGKAVSKPADFKALQQVVELSSDESITLQEDFDISIDLLEPIDLPPGNEEMDLDGSGENRLVLCYKML